MKIFLAAFLALSLAPGAFASAKTIEISPGKHKKKAKAAAADDDSDAKKKDAKKEPVYKTIDPAIFQACMSSQGAPAKLDAYVMLSLDEGGRVINVELAGDDPNLEQTPVGACIIDLAKKQSGLSPKDPRPTLHVVLTKS